MSLYNHSDYRLILSELVKSRRTFEPRFGFHKLAEAARIQKPYMSKVMSGTANLSSDQLYRIGKFLELSDEEMEYIGLCLELARTAVAAREKELTDKINHIAEQHRDTTKHLSAKVLATDNNVSNLSEYYLDPMIQLVHVALAIPKYSENPMSLAKDLNIDGPQMHVIVTSLEKAGLVERDGQTLIPREMTLHLPKSSPLYRAWRNQTKLLTIQKLNSLSSDDATYSFSTVFTATEATKKKVHERFLEFLKSCESDVKSAVPKQMYQMSFDLFSWEKS